MSWKDEIMKNNNEAAVVNGDEFVKSVKFMKDVGVQFTPEIVEGLLEKYEEVERGTVGSTKLVGFLEAVKESDYSPTLLDKVPAKIEECAQNIGQSKFGLEGNNGGRC